MDEHHDFNGRGEWVSGATYALADVVGYNGVAYVCLVENTGALPTNEMYWEVFATIPPESGGVGPTGPSGANGLPGAPGTIVAVGSSPPDNPEVGDLWVDTSDV